MISIAVCDWDGRTEQIVNDLCQLNIDRVFLCVEDRHIKYRQDNVREFIDLLIAHQFDVVLNPWGVAELFAGETVSRAHIFSYINWLQFAETTNARTIMLDEPNYKGLGDLLTLAREYAPSKKIHLAIQPEHTNFLSLLNIDETSISTYLFETQFDLGPDLLKEKFEDWRLNIIPKDASVWVQTWGIPKDKFPVIKNFYYYALLNGFDINIWAFEGFKTVSSKRSPDHEKIWDWFKQELSKGK